ncbi:MAG: ABC transporter ATP-binding protein [Thermomicrobiales bacterium]
MDQHAPILSTQQLGRTFRGLEALAGIDLKVLSGEIVGVIGPNGAGKSTLFNIITGFLPPTTGRVLLRDTDVSGSSPHRIASLGVARTFQNIRLFDGMTTLDNVVTARQLHDRAGFLPTLMGLPSFHSGERRLRHQAMDLLDQFGLAELSHVPAGSLPYGSQRKLEIVRALATGPSVLLLDEPAAGMNAQETAALTTLIQEVHARFNLTLVVVEHDMSLIMRLCQRIIVLNHGRMIAEGTPVEVRANPHVVEAYLGAGQDDPAQAATGEGRLTHADA